MTVRRRSTNVLGWVILSGSLLVVVWRVVDVLLMALSIDDFGGMNPVLTNYFITNLFDLLWVGLLGVAGLQMVRRSAFAKRTILFSLAAWMPGTVMYARGAASIGDEVGSKATYGLLRPIDSNDLEGQLCYRPPPVPVRPVSHVSSATV